MKMSVEASKSLQKINVKVLQKKYKTKTWENEEIQGTHQAFSSMKNASYLGRLS